MTNLSNDDFPDFEPELIFELEEKAKLTDVISPSNISAKGFLVNGKVKNLLSGFVLMEYKYFPATVIFRKEKLEYYWLHFKENEHDFLANVNFKSSSFFIANLAFMRVDSISIQSYEDFIDKKANLSMKHILADKIALNNTLMAQNYDLFYISYINNNFFASESLKKAIADKNITGFSIIEQSVL
jgi:hypothetical protein